MTLRHRNGRINLRAAGALAAAALLVPPPAAQACDVHLGLGSTSLGSFAARPIVPPSPALSTGNFSLDVPAYHSRPGATAAIYLDFDGDFTAEWSGFHPGLTPAYSTDTDTTTFSSQELSNIHSIWSQVSEKFSPFNIDVTTVDPGNRDNLRTVQVVIGGDGRNGAANYWLGQSAGGVAYTFSFSNTEPNQVWVFPGRLSNGDPRFVADASSHESGHSFGLWHQSLYNAAGVKIAEYNPGDPQRAPIMGRSYDSARSMWWNGTSLLPTQLQDDLGVISSPINAFGLRADDHANVRAAATALAITGSSASGAGVIEQVYEGFLSILNDVDYFSFDTLAGDVSFTLDVAPFGAMLDASLELYSFDGQLLARAATASLGESFNLPLAAGSYYLAVSSAGHYGDIGQYFLSGTIVAVPEPAALASLGAFVLLASRRRAG